MKKNLIAAMAICLGTSAFAQPSRAYLDSLNKVTQADYSQMLSQLGIQRSAVRPGPSGNPKDPNAANSAEEKVNQYTLSDPLTLKNGQKVKTPKVWFEKRRPELVSDFESEIYGRLPQHIPGISWTLVAVTDTVVGNQPIRQKLLKGTADNSAYPAISVEIRLLVVTPMGAKAAVPLVLEFGFIRSPFNPGPVKPIGLGSAGEPTWQEQLTSRGWGYAIIEPSSIQADNGAGLTRGIIGLVTASPTNGER